MSEEQKKKEPLDPNELGILLKEAAKRRLARERLGIVYSDSEYPFRDYIPPPPNRFKKN